MAKNVADQMVEILSTVGVRRIYGIVGDSLNGFTEALRHADDIDWLHVRHEEVAAFAAGADAATTGELAVCAGSCGPGNLHLINGLFDCHRSRVPVLAIAAQIPSAEIGSGFFQETHPDRLFQECSGYCELISDPAQMPYAMNTAIRHAVANRCVAVLVIPGNVALQQAPSVALPSRQSLLPARPKMMPDTASVGALANLINGAERVTLLCGAGCRDAKKALLALGDKIKAPMVHALNGKDAVEPDNPFDVGMTGLIGFSSGYYAMENCDALVLLGTDFPYRQFYPDHARIAQVDIRGEVLGRRTSIELGVLGGVEETLEAVMPLLDAKDNTRHLDRCREHYRDARKGLDQLAEGKPGGPLHPQQVTQTASDHAGEGAIFTCDVGLPTVWAARHLDLSGNRRLIGSYWHGSMANAMAQAIGAQAAHPNRPVIALAGDGGFSMLMGDLLTLKQLALPVKVVIFNNASLGFIELEQKSTGFLDTGTRFDNPDFAALAEAVGIKGLRLTDPSESDHVFEQAMAFDGPVIIDAVVSRMELAMPPKVKAEMVKGFTLYMLKAVLNGHADELVELASVNFSR